MCRARRGGPRTPSTTTDANIDCALCGKHTYSHLSSIVKSQQNKIELVANPGAAQPAYGAQSEYRTAAPGYVAPAGYQAARGGRLFDFEPPTGGRFFDNQAPRDGRLFDISTDPSDPNHRIVNINIGQQQPVSGASKGTNFHPSVIRDHNEAIFRSQTRANGQFSGGSLVDLNSVRKRQALETQSHKISGSPIKFYFL